MKVTMWPRKRGSWSGTHRGHHSFTHSDEWTPKICAKPGFKIPDHLSNRVLGQFLRAG